MAPDLFAGFAGPVLFLLAGAALQLVAPRPLEASFGARLGLSYLLGAAWTALTVWTAGFVLGAEVGRASYLVAGAVALGAGVAATISRRGGAGGWRRVRRPTRGGAWAARALAGAAAVLSIVLVADAMVHPVSDFDGRMTWGTLARYVQADRSVLPRAVVDSEAFVVHPRYPLVLPLLQVAASELAGEPLESRAVRPLYALFYPALLLALWPQLRRSGGMRGAAIAAAAWGALPALLWDQEVGPLGTYSDLPLAAFLGAGLALLLHPAGRRERWRGLFAGLLLAGAAGAKNEGLLLAPAAVVAVAFVGRAELRPMLRRAAAPLAVALLLIVAWRTEIPNRNDEGYFARLTPAALESGTLDRLPRIASDLLRGRFDPAAWGLLAGLPLLWVTGAAGLTMRSARAAGLFLAAQATLVLLAYAVTPDLAIVTVTRDRFLLQALPFLALVTAATGRAAWLAARRMPPR